MARPAGGKYLPVVHICRSRQGPPLTISAVEGEPVLARPAFNGLRNRGNRTGAGGFAFGVDALRTRSLMASTGRQFGLPCRGHLSLSGLPLLASALHFVPQL